MVRRTLKTITAKISGLHQAAFWLASFSILSQILAFLRDRLLAHNFGAGEELDIYYAAFRIPDLIFVTLGSLVSISVLVPMFSKKAIANDGGIKPYLNSVFTSFSVIISVSCLAAFLFMPKIIPVFFRGFSAEALIEIIKFSRILILSPLLLGFSNFFGSIIQYEKRFLLYSLSPLFYNVGIIVGTVLGAKEFGILAVVLGVVLGASLHLLAPLGYLIFSNNLPRISTRINFSEIKETILVSIPRALALSTTQIVSIFFTAVAAFFGAGAVAVFNFAMNLQSVPLSIVGVSYSLAAFPTISENHAQQKVEECGKYVGESLRFIIFWTLPLSAVFIILRSHIIRTVLGSGAFGWTDTKLTAAVMAVFALSFVFQSLQIFLTRAHYALGKTKVPLILGLIGAFITIVLAFLFYLGFLAEPLLWLQKFLEIDGLASSKIIILPTAFFFGAAFSAFGLWFSLSQGVKLIAKQGLLKTTKETMIASFIIALVSFYSLRIFDRFFILDSFINVFGHALISGLVGIGAGAVFLYFVRNRELREIMSKFRPHPPLSLSKEREGNGV